MGHEPDPTLGRRRIREIVYVCDGVALGFMFGIPAAALVLGRLSWGLVFVSFVGWSAMIALASGVGRRLEAGAVAADERSDDAGGSGGVLGLQHS